MSLPRHGTQSTHTLKEQEKPLTIDERIERLTERHEALAQTVESITLDIRDLKDIAAKSLDSVNALLRIAESHERRITNLEG
jgi:hypothetical protein